MSTIIFYFAGNASSRVEHCESNILKALKRYDVVQSFGSHRPVDNALRRLKKTGHIVHVKGIGWKRVR